MGKDQQAASGSAWGHAAEGGLQTSTSRLIPCAGYNVVVIAKHA